LTAWFLGMKSDVCYLKRTVSGTRALRGSSRIIATYGRKEIITVWNVPRFWNSLTKLKPNIVTNSKCYGRVGEKRVKIHVFIKRYVLRTMNAPVSQKIFFKVCIYLYRIYFYLTRPPNPLNGKVLTKNWNK
jgi:hypothetical protein